MIDCQKECDYTKVAYNSITCVSCGNMQMRNRKKYVNKIAILGHVFWKNILDKNVWCSG